MAMTVHLTITANGNDIKGDSTQLDLDRADTIECVEYSHKIRSAREKGSRKAIGKPVIEPLEFIARKGRATPLLTKALVQNELIEGAFRFYRPNDEDGTVEHYYTVSFKKARIDYVETHSPNALDPTSSEAPALTKVGIVPGEMECTYEPDGISHPYSWSGQT